MSWKLQTSIGGGLPLHHSFPWVNKYELAVNARPPSFTSTLVLVLHFIHPSIHPSCTQGCEGLMVPMPVVMGARRSPICPWIPIGQDLSPGAECLQGFLNVFASFKVDSEASGNAALKKHCSLHSFSTHFLAWCAGGLSFFA